MAEQQAPASGVGIVTLTLAWDEGTGEMALQVAPGGNWGAYPAVAQERLYHALKAATDKAQESYLEVMVQERLAKEKERGD